MARPGKEKEFDVLKAVKLRMEKGLSFKSIGKLLKVSPQAVQTRLKRLGEAFNDPQQVAVLKAHEPVMIDGIRALLLERMGTVLGDNTSKISFSQLALGYAIMLDKARLIRGETSGGIQQITALIIAAHKVKLVTPTNEGKSKEGKVIDVTPTHEDEEQGDEA